MADKARVLLVEDEVITATSLKLELEKAGYYVCPLATRGDKAIKIALVEKPDVVLMDVNLAGNLNGIETAQTILETLDTKFIFVSGYHDDELVKKINTLNPLDYVIKPVSVERIMGVMDANF
ncbi:MAG: response regulator [Candidatus Marinimicrobia bacterium]|jgi:two-component system, response regulator PdtaR|nr:response regulator [Candidatus Neomarinimicrobiota bacterium]MBT3630199.1 response regulator [Candidatus Neomarinimicrobiota bacterium]MBT3826151.1 response regulator [Candidatus Neomarinimicrobiota bacterium]MBT4132395.1 response regulator [Candidatus Neomarinimicrobiota bacterium]MBT4294506.1 response regulator [Candidatus Neomarinimicrobiota bacterium]